MLLGAISFVNLQAREYHVAIDGSNSNPGTVSQPLRTISYASQLAEPGDEIVIHEGIYRERITPLRGGESETRRIVYRAARNEKVSIKGSEVVTGWKKHSGTVWKVILPNSFFGDYNPFTDTIWGDWFNDHGRKHHTGEVYMNDRSFFESATLDGVLEPVPVEDAVDREGSIYSWYCESDDKNTTIYANFHGSNPNKELVEINVRKACFYPERTGVNYITIRGIHLSQAATQWAAPTAEQIGLIGTHWSKGWIIEECIISHSKCVGIALGKERSTGHNVWLRNPEKDGATHYNEVIFRALKIGWSQENIGTHIIRNNTIYECGQAGIVGSLGAVFSQIYNNHIYSTWGKRMFSGAEMAGIKIHASVDMIISDNCIHHTGRGLWLDWMAQGTRVTGNLLYENTTDDLFVEVNHGPYMVDNNIFLSPVAIRDWSEGGAFAHNLVNGLVSINKSYVNRATPYLLAHSTEVAALRDIGFGDDRFFNNIFIRPENTREDNWAPKGRIAEYGLEGYQETEFEIMTGGNVYYNGALPYKNEAGHQKKPTFNPGISIEKKGNEFILSVDLDNAVKNPDTKMVSTELLGETIISGLPWENPDGSELEINVDYFGNERSGDNPVAGPFRDIKEGRNEIRVW